MIRYSQLFFLGKWFVVCGIVFFSNGFEIINHIVWKEKRKKMERERKNLVSAKCQCFSCIITLKIC